LIEVRLNHARNLLTAGAGERSLAELAEASGFADQSHLTRHMRRVLGVTPGMLREQNEFRSATTRTGAALLQ
jgi:AraC-like DNA-binding protein